MFVFSLTCTTCFSTCDCKSLPARPSFRHGAEASAFAARMAVSILWCACISSGILASRWLADENLSSSAKTHVDNESQNMLKTCASKRTRAFCRAYLEACG